HHAGAGIITETWLNNQAVIVCAYPMRLHSSIFRRTHVSKGAKDLGFRNGFGRRIPAFWRMRAETK
ncbi:MAG: hypothetical protein QNJ02_01325, partial [Desulfobacterales bacterium]|nr:hypothetical protein [Desulfobacterales bacterium]